jgi:hypothetical protein
MVKELTTTKISPDALRNLRIIAAMTGESQYEVLDRLLEAELKEVKKKDDETI